jgi:hypothetical protein
VWHSWMGSLWYLPDRQTADRGPRLKQGVRHLRFGEFSVITGYTGYLLWRVGLLKVWLRLAVRKLDLPAGKAPLISA